MANGNDRLTGPRSAGELRTISAIALWSAVTLFAVVLLSRRIGGAFVRPLSPSFTCLLATMTTFCSLLAHALWSTANVFDRFSRKETVAVAITLAPPLAVGATLAGGSSALAAGYLTGLSLVSAFAIVAIRELVRPDFVGGFCTESTSGEWNRLGALPNPPLASEPVIAAAAQHVTGSKYEEQYDDSEQLIDEEQDATDATMLQWMTRRQLPDAREAIEGAVRVSFSAGEKTAVVHVSFMPPLAARPTADCHVLVDFDGRVRIAAVHSYGLRIEARRNQYASATSVEVGFTAEASGSQASAA